MKTLTYIEFSIEYIFDKKNDRQIMYSYLLRKLLNWTPRQVAKYLSLSINQINNLNTARLYRLSSTNYLDAVFAANHGACLEACERYVCLKHLQKYQKGSMISKSRLEKRVKELQN